MNLAGWANFFSAEVGASASLTGLVIVAISINLTRIVETPPLPGRAVETLAMLMGVLIVSSVALVPGQSSRIFGMEILAIGAAVWAIGVITQFLARGVPIPGKKWAPLFRVLVAQVASLPFVIAGISILLGSDAGIYWILPGVIFCLLAGMLSAWVLLVEVVR
jgi:hypothetical protein